MTILFCVREGHYDLLLKDLGLFQCQGCWRLREIN